MKGWKKEIKGTRCSLAHFPLTALYCKCKVSPSPVLYSQTHKLFGPECWYLS